MPSISRIIPQDVARRVQAGESFTFVDARSEKSFAASGVQIPGSIRISPEQTDLSSIHLPEGRPIVTYCT